MGLPVCSCWLEWPSAAAKVKLDVSYSARFDVPLVDMVAASFAVAMPRLASWRNLNSPF